MSKLTWTNETRTLRDLIPHADNPRHISEAAGERLKHSLRKFEQPLPILIEPDNSLVDGHQRLDKWAEEWGLDLEAAVRVSSRPLSDAERKELVVLLHRGATGEFDFEALGEWAEQEELVEWGLDLEELELFDPDLIEFPEYDEGIANEVEYLECPECGHRFPK